MEPIQQAKFLVQALSAARKELRKDLPHNKIDESEVGFRFSSVDGLLIMAINDASALVEDWEQEERLASLTRIAQDSAYASALKSVPDNEIKKLREGSWEDTPSL